MFIKVLISEWYTKSTCVFTKKHVLCQNKCLAAKKISDNRKFTARTCHLLYTYERLYWRVYLFFFSSFIDIYVLQVVLVNRSIYIIRTIVTFRCASPSKTLSYISQNLQNHPRETLLIAVLICLLNQFIVLFFFTESNTDEQTDIIHDNIQLSFEL